MKLITLAAFCLISMAAISQNESVDVILNNKPAKLNTETGEYEFIDEDKNSSKRSSKSNSKSSNTHNAKKGLHTVSKNETLYSISKRYGISVAQIKSVNNLKSNILRIGQELVIGYSSSRIIKNTEKYPSKSTHIVTKGETLYRIAKNANISVEQLKTLNSLKNNRIFVGQVLKLK